jgi:hypothetical protein
VAHWETAGVEREYFQSVSVDLPSTDSFKAKLQIHLYPRIHLCADEHMGSHPDVSNEMLESVPGILLSFAHRGASYGLINGGPSGLVWTYIGAVFGFGTVILSMAEMSSM